MLSEVVPHLLQRYPHRANEQRRPRPQPGVQEHELDLATKLGALLLALDEVHLLKNTLLFK